MLCCNVLQNTSELYMKDHNNMFCKFTFFKLDYNVHSASAWILVDYYKLHLCFTRWVCHYTCTSPHILSIFMINKTILNWREPQNNRLQKQLAQAVVRSNEVLKRILTFWAGLQDLSYLLLQMQHIGPQVHIIFWITSSNVVVYVA